MSAWCIYALFFVVYLERLSCCVRVGDLRESGQLGIRRCLSGAAFFCGLHRPSLLLALGSWLLCLLVM